MVYVAIVSIDEGQINVIGGEYEDACFQEDL